MTDMSGQRWLDTGSPFESSPRRIQRKRTKGWRMPDNTVYVGRGSKYGNAWKVGDYLHGEIITPELAVELFSLEVDTMDLSDLRNKNCACWCRLDQACHADVLLELANSEVSE